MKNKISTLLVLGFFILTLTPASYATGGKEAAASLLVPTTGQAMNNELGATKTKVMGGVEVASVATTVILGLSTGGASVLWGALPLAANHIWSSVDAYKSAKRNDRDPYLEQQMMEAQRTIDLSRQRRFEREQDYRSGVYDRVKRAAGEEE